jgi:TolB-like protein
MLTGRRPFQGNTQMELAASIMRDQPPRITRANAPDRLVALVEQCLVKSERERVQSAGSLASSLRATARSPASVPQRPRDEGFWVAVMRFKFSGTSPELAALAEGLTEEIAACLSQFSYFRVMTTAAPGARYAIEGSLRQSGGQLRVAVRLIDSETGANLWAENYARAWSPDAVFETQDSLVPTIVSTIAETNGVLAHSAWIALRDRDPATLTPYEAMLRSFGYNEHLTPDEHRLALVGLKRAIDQLAPPLPFAEERGEHRDPGHGPAVQGIERQRPIPTSGSRPCTDSSAIALKPRRRCASWTPSTRISAAMRDTSSTSGWPRAHSSSTGSRDCERPGWAASSCAPPGAVAHDTARKARAPLARPDIQGYLWRANTICPDDSVGCAAGAPALPLPHVRTGL